MRAIASISAFVLLVAMSILAAPADSHASPEDDARLRAAIVGPEKPKDLEEVAHLLDKGANPNARDEFGRTAVHYAAGGTTGRHGTGEVFRLLLARGGDCCMKEPQGDTPLHYAVAAANHPLSDDADVEGRIRILLGSGADPNEPNRRGYTPLHFSAKTEEFIRGTVVIRGLLQAGADPNAVAADGNTPLHLAAGIPVILDSGHGHNFSSMGWDAGEHILTDDGIPGNDADVVDALLVGGANPNVVNNAGMTPLLVVLTIEGAGRLAEEEAVKSLLSAGADPNAARRDGFPPLHIVLNYPESRSIKAHRIVQESITLVEALLGAGADPDVKNPQGDTLLHVAVRQEWGEDMVEALLAGGADPCIRNHKEGWVPEQLARGLGQSDVELALQLGGGYMFDCEKREEDKLGLDRDARRRIQSCLTTQGFDPGAPDGLFGPRTRGAISAWQEAQGDGGEATGYLTQAELDDLLASCKSAAPTPLCTGDEDTPCWMETSNQPGCHVWRPRAVPDETVTWSGSCIDGKASGRGKVVWRFIGADGTWKTFGSEGELGEGKALDGHRIEYFSDGEVWEGTYENGKRHGRFVKRGTRGETWVCMIQGDRVDTGRGPCASEAADGEMQATKGIALRSGPTDDYEEIGRLAIDDTVTVTRKAGQWAWVETDSGQQGFVPLSALEELEKPAVAEVEKPAAAKVEKLAAAKEEIKEPEVAAVVTEPKCASGHDSQCWMEISNRSGCFFFLDFDFFDITDQLTLFRDYVDVIAEAWTSLHWSGKCIAGVATGKGIMTAIANHNDPINRYVHYYEMHWSGTLSRGKWDGLCSIQESYNYEYLLGSEPSYSESMTGELELNYKEGIPHGPITWKRQATTHHEPGSKISISNDLMGLFHEGNPHGEWQERGVDPGGTSIVTLNFDNGILVKR